MTPLFGLVTAFVAAWLVPNRRALLISVWSLMAVGTAVQTWSLLSGRGSNPPSTVNVGYWIVQVLIVAVVTGVAYGVFRVRERRTLRAGRVLERPTFSGARGARVLAASLVVAAGVLIPGMIMIDDSHRHHGQGAGNIPWTGVLGIVLGLVALLVLAVVLTRGARADRRAGRLA